MSNLQTEWPQDVDGDVMFIVPSLLSYDLVMSVQKEISEFAAPCGGMCDSWGVMQQ